MDLFETRPKRNQRKTLIQHRLRGKLGQNLGDTLQGQLLHFFCSLITVLLLQFESLFVHRQAENHHFGDLRFDDLKAQFVDDVVQRLEVLNLLN